MERNEALEQINYMKGLLNSTRLRTAEGYPFFILWGIIWFTGYISSTWLGYYVWGILGFIGGTLSGIIGKKWKWTSTNHNKLLKQLGYQYFLLFIISSLIFAIFIWSDITWIQNIYWPMAIGVIYMNAGFFMGNDLVLIGLGLILMSAVSLLIPGFLQVIFLAIVGGGGLVITGLIFRNQVQKLE